MQAMPTKRLLRVLIVTEIALGAFYLDTMSSFEAGLPEPLRAYDRASPEPAIWQVVCYLLIAIAALGSRIGLFFFWRPARPLYLATILALLGTSLDGPSVETAFGAVIQQLLVLISGAVVTLVYVSPLKHRFKKASIATARPRPNGIGALPAKAIYALAATPMLWVAWFYVYVLRQRLHLGFWPAPCQPDPKQAGFFLHHLSLYLGASLVPVLALVGIGFSIQRRIVDASFRWWLPLAVAALSLVCFFGFFHLDLGYYWTWFCD
jgi:hypothetical protein